MDIKKIKIKSSGEIIKPKGNLYFSNDNFDYDIPLSNIEVVDDNYVNIKDVANWGRFIVDLEKGLKNGNKDK